MTRLDPHESSHDGRPLMLRWFDEDGKPWFYVSVTHASTAHEISLFGGPEDVNAEERDELREIIARAARLCEGRDTAMVLQVLREAQADAAR